MSSLERKFNPAGIVVPTENGVQSNIAVGFLPTKSADIVIVGNGITGLSLARKLSKQNDIQSTVVAPLTPELVAPSLPVQARTSTPIIRESTLRELDVPVDSNTGIHARNVSVAGHDIGRVRRRILQAIQTRRTNSVSNNPKYFLDIDLTRRQMYEDLQGDPNITFVDGRLTDLTIDNGRISVIDINNGAEQIEPGIVIDATGRKAIVAEKVGEKLPGVVTEKKILEPSILIGGFATFDNSVIEDNPELSAGSNTIFLPNGTVLYIAPIMQIPESSATHGIYISGNTETIAGAHKSSQKKGAEKLTREKHFLTTIKGLTEGTDFEGIVERITSLDRLVFFSHKHSLRRVIESQGLNMVLAGDSQAFVNPISGSGFKNIAEDITRLASVISEEDNLDNAVVVYNRSSQNNGRKRLLESHALYRVLDGVVKFFGMGSLKTSG